MLRSLAIKTRTVGQNHRSLVPSLTKLAALYKDVGDVHNLKVTLEHRLRIIEQEAAKEQSDFESLGLTAPTNVSMHTDVPTEPSASLTLPAVQGTWMREVRAPVIVAVCAA